MTRKLFAFIAAIILPIAIHAQPQRIEHQRITNSNGLSNSSVNCIFQDSEGLMWFGTWDGLNRYDGRHFRVFKPDPSDLSTISNNVIRDVSEQTPGVMWISTDKGLNRFDCRTGTFERWFDNLEVSFEDSYHHAISPNGSVLAFINGYGCYLFNEKSREFRKLFSVDSCKKAFFDGKSGLWLLSKTGELDRYTFNPDYEVTSVTRISNDICLAMLDPEHDRVALHHLSGTLSISSYPYGEEKSLFRTPHLNALAFLGETIRFADEDGLSEYDISTGHKTRLLKEHRIMSILSGSQDILWVGTDMMGVLKIAERHNSPFLAYPLEGENPFGSSAVRCFGEPSAGKLMVGTKGTGLYHFDYRSERAMRHYSTSNGLIDNSVYSMAKDNRGRIWIGTEGAGLNYYEDGRLKKLNMNDNSQVASVYSILPWDSNTLYVGTSGNGLFRLDISDSQVLSCKKAADGIVYSILRLSDEEMLIGTRGKGVWRFNVESGKLSSFSQGLSTLDVLAMHLDVRGYLWIGTSTGLYLVKQDTEGGLTIQRISEKDNLPNNTVHVIMEDSFQRIWVSTNNGLARLDERNNGFKITSYSIADGLRGNEFCDGAGAVLRNGKEIAFGNIGGLTAFDPSAVTTSLTIPHLFLDSFRIDNEEAKFNPDGLEVSGKVNSISFSFTPVDYLNGHRCKIAYRLDGNDREWIDIGNAGTIVLGRMKAGKHTLRVRCSSADGEWGDAQIVLPVRVLSVWYASVAAKIIYLLLFLLFAGAIAWALLQRMKTHDEIVRTESVHQAKLKFFTDIAHEFSNSLTLIYGPCVQILRDPRVDARTRKYASLIENSSERMRTLIQELIDFRKAETGHLSLHCNDVDLKALATKEIDYFRELLSERSVSIDLKIGEGICSWKTDQDSLEKMVFNLLSNASKYTPAGGAIELSISTRKGNLVVSVTNFGVGISEDKMSTIFNRFVVLDRYEKDVARGRRSSGNGIGLAMCKNLSELLGGSIKVDSDGSSFVKFSISLPQMNEEVEEMTAGSGQLMEWRPAFIGGDEMPETTENPEEDRSKPMMLVVDDDLQICQFISDLFSREFNVVKAENGRLALEEVRKRRPDVIISDVVMPVMSGVDMLKTLKNNDLTRQIPVVLLSSKGTVDNQIEGLSEGADSYLSKPFNPKQLVAVVSSLLNRGKAIMEYSNSALTAVDVFEGKVLKKNVKDLLTAVTESVHKNLSNENLTIEMVAEDTAVSKIKLYRVIKESMGMTPTQYIRNIRIQHAEKLLRTTNMTVQEIIYACGFASKAYFYKMFSEAYGMTPKDYRTRNKASFGA